MELFGRPKIVIGQTKYKIDHKNGIFTRYKYGSSEIDYTTTIRSAEVERAFAEAFNGNAYIYKEKRPVIAEHYGWLKDAERDTRPSSYFKEISLSPLRPKEPQLSPPLRPKEPQLSSPLRQREEHQHPIEISENDPMDVDDSEFLAQFAKQRTEKACEEREHTFAQQNQYWVPPYSELEQDSLMDVDEESFDEQHSVYVHQGSLVPENLTVDENIAEEKDDDIQMEDEQQDIQDVEMKSVEETEEEEFLRSYYEELDRIAEASDRAVLILIEEEKQREEEERRQQELEERKDETEARQDTNL